MNAIEQMQGELAILTRRVARVEEDLRAKLADTDDRTLAIRLARDLGFEPEILLLGANRNDPRGFTKQKRLARALRAKGFSYSRVARVFDVAENTVKQWTK